MLSTQIPVVPVLDSGVRVRQSLMTRPPVSCAPPATDPQAPVNRVPLIIAVSVAVAGTVALFLVYGPRSATLLAIGTALGFALFHSRFGFTSGWQQLIAVGNGQGLRAQLVLFATAATGVMTATAAHLTLFEPSVPSQATRIGVGLVLGSVLFGFGMQLGGSCASGTLYAVGAGQSSILLTLAGFMAGGLFYTWAFPALGLLPSAPGVLLPTRVGQPCAWLITMAALAVVALITVWVQRRRVPPPVAKVPTASGVARLYRGAWPLTVGAVVLGSLATLVVLMTGHKWSVANAYSLWAAKLSGYFGLHPESWQFWQQPDLAASLNGPVLTDQTSLTDFGIMIGAAAAAAAAGGWQLHGRVPLRIAVSAATGGILMGFGARMSGGCNIGALLGGISLGDLSGWIWGACALLGTWVGIRARSVIGLHVPKPQNSVC